MEDLKEKGYCIIPGVLSPEEVDEARRLFFNWQETIQNHDQFHLIFNPHGIYKYHEVGQQEHAWYIRTRPKVIEIFKKLWGCDELVVSFDGTNYMPKIYNQTDRCWTHTDQSSNKKGFHCCQGFVALTDNKERTLVVYEGSHKLHEKYFEERNIKDSINWFVLEKDYVKSLEHLKRVLEVPKGSLVLWDSRTFHQNQYGTPYSEERLVQYVCYLPKNNPKNTEKMKEKRLKYFETVRTTSHWPYPITVVPLQPNSWGKDFLIDYNKLRKPDLERFMDDIKQLI